tara:strand:+ start:87633 stop:88193 length:561 start_codon:yes stop_codon:yes gene_type:complete
MSDTHETRTLTEAVGYFDNADRLQAAIDALLRAGFNRAELSLLASEKAVEDKLGHAYARPAELEDDPDVPRTAFVSLESLGDAEGGLIGGLMYVGALAAVGGIVASGGALAAAAAAALVGGTAGGLIGTGLASLVGESHANYIEEQLVHGGLLLWVRTRDADHEARATAILREHSGRDVHLHALPG